MGSESVPSTMERGLARFFGKRVMTFPRRAAFSKTSSETPKLSSTRNHGRQVRLFLPITG